MLHYWWIGACMRAFVFCSNAGKRESGCSDEKPGVGHVSSMTRVVLFGSKIHQIRLPMNLSYDEFVSR